MAANNKKYQVKEDDHPVRFHTRNKTTDCCSNTSSILMLHKIISHNEQHLISDKIILFICMTKDQYVHTRIHMEGMYGNIF